MRRWLNVTVFGLAVAVGGADVCRGELRYVVTDLGALGLRPFGINEQGEIVGTGPGTGAFLYDGGQVIDIGHIDPGGGAIFYDVNDRGEAVGRWSGAGIDFNALYYDGVQLHDLGAMGGMRSMAHDINNEGNIVGYVGGSSRNYGFLLQDGELITFDSLIPDNSKAYAINGAGRVVGTAGLGTGQQQRAFVYDGANVVYLQALGGDDSWAFGINELGQVVGQADLPDGRYHACLWDGGSITDLGALGGGSSMAVAINDSGVVVGYLHTGTPESPLFVYDGATMWDVNDLVLNADGWRFDSTGSRCAINNAGQIVGNARFDGAWRGFLLTPVELVPEPPVAALLATACLAWWMNRCWRRRHGRGAEG